MSTLVDYIEHVREKTNNMSKLEKIRYVYIDLGKRFGFDINYSGGNSRTQREIYSQSKKMLYINKGLENNTGICTSISLTYSYVLKALDIKCDVCYTPGTHDYLMHAFNEVYLDSKTSFYVDLQRDLVNIQSNAFPKYFGEDVETGNNKFSRTELEQLDRKIGYITNEKYYSDEYIYLLKYDKDWFDNFHEKAKFLIENIEPFGNPNRKYLELRWYHEQVLRQVFTRQELNKIKQVDCYIEKEDKKDYIPCICVEKGINTDIYLYDYENQRYQSISMENFVMKIGSGMKVMQTIPNLKRFINRKKEDLER